LPQEGTAQVVRGLPKFDDANLVVGTEGFSDAAVYRLRDDLLIVQSLDFFPPLVDDPYTFGQIAAANSLSDIYAMGAAPILALNIVGFPDDQLDLEILGAILRGGADKVKEAGAVIGGGHTVRDAEIKYGLSATGVVTPQRLLTNSKAQPGDVLVLTKPLGTGYVTTAFKAGRCPDDVLAAATASMAQLNKIGADVAAEVGAHAATDITGFGLVGHAGEMALSSGVTIEIELSKLPLITGVTQLVEAGYKTRASTTNRTAAEPILRIEGRPDPLRLEIVFDAQTSGGLLLSVPEASAEKLLDSAREAGAAHSAVIGRVLPKSERAIVLRG
jgi:selenide,water dikinase